MKSLLMYILLSFAGARLPAQEARGYCFDLHDKLGTLYTPTIIQNFDGGKFKSMAFNNAALYMDVNDQKIILRPYISPSIRIDNTGGEYVWYDGYVKIPLTPEKYNEIADSLRKLSFKKDQEVAITFGRGRPILIYKERSFDLRRPANYESLKKDTSIAPILRDLKFDCFYDNNRISRVQFYLANEFIELVFLKNKLKYFETTKGIIYSFYLSFHKNKVKLASMFDSHNLQGYSWLTQRNGLIGQLEKFTAVPGQIGLDSELLFLFSKKGEFTKKYAPIFYCDENLN